MYKMCHWQLLTPSTCLSLLNKYKCSWDLVLNLKPAFLDLSGQVWHQWMPNAIGSCVSHDWFQHDMFEKLTEKELLNDVLFTTQNFRRLERYCMSHIYFHAIFMLFFFFFCPCWGLTAPGDNKLSHTVEHLLCSIKERKPYRLGMTWRWINDEGIFIFWVY